MTSRPVPDIDVILVPGPAALLGAIVQGSVGPGRAFGGRMRAALLDGRGDVRGRPGRP
ncbi:hypothetical protein AGRA3207_001314 [Actinomadura graeca]|uniref:Uncharacterized protein n=1 Tax=Actinomadura graeca TaxID=2750812 RepID=A0ABX8QP60_9ACTN|nr:hypothetical protein [Actinomadura graeca]QXJ20579.1 hypothetical protein AGRA3207_001314 [Actinomadura graeca]